MDTPIFDTLKDSLKETVAISKGEAQPARRTVFTSEEVHAIRQGRGYEVKAARMASKSKNSRVLRDIDISQNEFVFCTTPLTPLSIRR